MMRVAYTLTLDFDRKFLSILSWLPESDSHWPAFGLCDQCRKALVAKRKYDELRMQRAMNISLWIFVQ